MPTNPRTPQNNMGEIRRQAGYTQKAAAEASGIPLGTLRRWEQGQNDPDMGSLMKLAELYHTTLDSMLITRQEIPGKVLQMRRSPSHPMPVVGRIAAGTPREAIYQAGETHETPDDLWQAHPDGFWLEVSGNSMNRLFPEGTLVLVDPDEEVRNGDVGVVFVNGDDATLKRVYYDGETVRLHPESHDPEYQDRVIDRDDPDAPEVRVLGRAVAYASPDGWRA